LEITPNLADKMKEYYLQRGVGHYGVFNGGKWRSEIAPRIKRFIRAHDHEVGTGSGRHMAVPADWRGGNRRGGRANGTLKVASAAE
jgi:hypothetical protein